jgi:hypothetical protein
LYAQAGVTRAEAERQISLLEPEASQVQASFQALPASQVTPDAEQAQRAVLNTLDAQGPAAARLLESIANASPSGLTVRSVQALPDGEFWKVTIDAFAAGRDDPRARLVADTFLRSLEGSGVVGDAPQLPTRRIVGGSDGVELRATYRVRR